MRFTTGEIISAGTGKLCCSIERVYVIMNFLTGDTLYTHQLPRAFYACEAWVKQQHPWLNSLNIDACNKDNWRAWLANVIQDVGQTHELQPLPSGQWQPRDPIQEAVDLMGGEKDRVCVVNVPAQKRTAS